MYIRIHIHMYTCIYIYMNRRIFYPYVHTYIYMFIFVYMCINIYICIHICIYMYTELNLYTHVSTEMYLYMYIYTHVSHIHTCMHSHTLTSESYPFTRSINISDRYTKDIRHMPDNPSNAIEAIRWKNDTAVQNSARGMILYHRIKNTKLLVRARKRLVIWDVDRGDYTVMHTATHCNTLQQYLKWEEVSAENEVDRQKSEITKNKRAGSRGGKMQWRRDLLGERANAPSARKKTLRCKC